MSELLKRYHASNPVGAQKVSTLEFAHSAAVTTLSDAVLVNGALRLVRAMENLTAAINENISPSMAEFVKSGMAFSFPKRDSSGRQELNFQIDNVTRDAQIVIRAIQRANRLSAERCRITLRSYLMSDLETIQESYEFTAKRFEINRSSVSVTGAFHELVNRRAPKRLYLTEQYPGLKYL